MMECDSIRKIIKEISYFKKMGHVGGSLSCVEMLKTIFENKQHDDKFILSKGHAMLAYYALMVYLKEITLEDLLKYDLPIHPSIYFPICPDWSSGSLGHGISLAIGFSLNNIKTFVLSSEGEFEEGTIWEGIDFAGKHRLKIVNLIDINGLQAYKSYDKKEFAKVLKKRLESFNWNVFITDGHNESKLNRLIKKESYPLAILSLTVKGKGVITLENKLSSHYYPIQIGELK